MILTELLNVIKSKTKIILMIAVVSVGVFVVINENIKAKRLVVAGVVEDNGNANTDSSETVDVSESVVWQDVLLVSFDEFKQYQLPNFNVKNVAKEAMPYFTVGNYWLYEYEVQYQENNSNDRAISRHKKNLKTEVIEVVGSNQLKVALVSNFPLHALFEEEKNLSTLILKDDKYYFIKGAEVFNQFKNNLNFQLDFSNYEYFPNNLTDLDVGAKWLTEDRSRTDDYYTYYIEDVIKQDSYKKIIVSYFTLPDQSRTEVVPRIGITQDHYVHQGSIIENYLKLIEFNVQK